MANGRSIESKDLPAWQLTPKVILRGFVGSAIGVGQNTVGVVAEHFVLALCAGIDDRRVGRARSVTTKAKEISRQPRFPGMTVIAAHAANALVKYAAAHDRGYLIILVPILAVLAKQLVCIWPSRW